MQNIPTRLAATFSPIVSSGQGLPAHSRSKAFHRARYALTADGISKMRSGLIALRAKGRITSQSFTVMSKDTRATFHLSSKDFNVIELISRKQYVRIADQLFRSHEDIVARMEARFDELERKLDLIETD